MGERSGAPSGFSPASIVISIPPVAVQLPQPDVSANRDAPHADPITDRPGFTKMLAALLANGARTIIVESPDRFARDLMVQLAGHDLLKAQGIALIAASAPTFFIEETPTAVLVRQVLGAVAQFDKASTVAKLAA